MRFRAILHRILIAASIALFAPTALAQGFIGKPRNTLSRPFDTTIDVEIHLTQATLEYREMNYRGLGISPLGDELARASFDRKERKHIHPAMATLTATPGTLDAAVVLEDALRTALAEVPGFHIGTVETYDASRPPPDASASPDKPILLIHAMYYMTPMLAGLRVELHALYGPRSVVLSPDLNTRGRAAFLQRVFHDVPVGDVGAWRAPQEAAAYWLGVGMERIREMTADGLRDGAGMVAYELQRKPRFGRIPGKQYSWEEGAVTDYGALETRQGERAWLRLRSGHLLSIDASGL